MLQSEITVRLANADDFECVRDLLRDGDRYHHAIGVFGVRSAPAEYAREAFVATLASEAAAIFIGSRDGRPLGFARIAQVDAPGGRFHAVRTYAEVHEIVVAESARGTGIGADLMRAAEAWARSRNMTSLELNCFGENPTARDFYTNLGFVESRIRFRQDLSARNGAHP